MDFFGFVVELLVGVETRIKTSLVVATGFDGMGFLFTYFGDAEFNGCSHPFVPLLRLEVDEEEPLCTFEFIDFCLGDSEDILTDEEGVRVQGKGIGFVELQFCVVLAVGGEGKG